VVLLFLELPLPVSTVAAFLPSYLKGKFFPITHQPRQRKGALNEI
jgi:hypothetical protein